MQCLSSAGFRTTVFFLVLLATIARASAQSVTIRPAAGFDECDPFPLVLRADTTGSGIVEWSDGSKADSLIIDTYGTYSVSFTTASGVSTDSFLIVKIDCCNPVIPTAFTPNGDGVNDQFGVTLQYCEVQILEFTVYSRWGELMFQALETTDRWDGTTLNGTEAPSDVYVYVTRYKVADETTEKFEKGGITLLR
jgi:gliding motility-associated-like protein